MFCGSVGMVFTPMHAHLEYRSRVSTYKTCLHHSVETECLTEPRPDILARVAGPLALPRNPPVSVSHL